MKLLFIFAIIGLILGVVGIGFHITYQYPMLGIGFHIGYKINTECDYALQKIEKEKSIEKKIEILENAIKKDKKSYKAYNRLAWLKVMEEEFYKAKEYFENALNLKPESKSLKGNINLVDNLIKNNAYAYFQLGSMLLENDDNIYQGIRFLKKSLEFNQIKEQEILTSIYYDLAIYYKAIGEYKKSLNNINKSLNINPDDKDALELKRELELLKKKDLIG